MGGGSWTSSDWKGYTSSRGISETSTVREIYKSSSIKPTMDPLKITIRESCDSTEHPNSRACIIGLDVTGSMGSLAEEIAKKALNTLITEVYDKKPIEDPQLMFMAIGDTECDESPLQVTQFESDIRIAEQLMDVWFEAGGGPNAGESYLAAWYYAAKHTTIDCFEKRGQKGFIFTIGDEPTLKVLTRSDIKKFFGDDVQHDFTAEELLNEVSRKYEVFHLIVRPCRNATESWKALLGQRAMLVTDHTKIPEIIESTMEVIVGKNDAASAAGKWDGSTSVVVNTAIGGLTAASSTSSGLVTL
jgi:hypothetical protein